MFKSVICSIENYNNIYEDIYKKYTADRVMQERDEEIFKSLSVSAAEDFDMYSRAIKNYTFSIDKIEGKTNIIESDYVSGFWKKYKNQIKEYIKETDCCPVCGLLFRKNFNLGESIEHVLPKSKYQQYIFFPINLVYFCESCNRNKSAEIEQRIYHPYFSKIDCKTQPVVAFKNKNKNTYIEITIAQDNEIYNYFINDLYKIPKSYRKYLEQVINIEISSIERLFDKKMRESKDEEKYKELKSYIVDGGLGEVDNPQFIKTEVERQLILALNKEIKDNPDGFTSYVIKQIKK